MVQSVKRAADILMVLAGDGQSMTLEEVARATNLNKSTCAHIIATLCDSFLLMQRKNARSNTLNAPRSRFPWA